MHANNEVIEITERINEWTGQKMDPDNLADMLWALCASPELREDFEQALSNAVCDYNTEMEEAYPDPDAESAQPVDRAPPGWKPLGY